MASPKSAATTSPDAPSTAPKSTSGQQTLTPGRPVRTAREVVSLYYERYNSGDIDGIAELVAEDVEYWDTVYSSAFNGRKELLAYLRKVRKIVPQDLRFVIEDATEGDQNRVGILWHVECGEGNVFPFSRGCSFYRVDEAGQIVTARDVVEPSIKPGAASLSVLAALTPLVRKLGPAADPANLQKLPLAQYAVWAFYVGYLAYVLLSSAAPGYPVYQTPVDQLLEVWYQSLNFFYVNIGLDALGGTPIPNVATPPVSEALFNFVIAWSMMFLPVMLSDGKSRKVGNKVKWWLGSMFLTNLFLIPFLALRAGLEPEVASAPTPSPATGGTSRWKDGTQAAPLERKRQQRPKAPPSTRAPGWSPIFGAVGLAVGLISIYWALEGRPEYGDLAARWDYTQLEWSTNRIFFAFVLDVVLYAVWQPVLLKDQPALYRFVPFFGLAAYCLIRPEPRSSDDE